MQLIPSLTTQSSFTPGGRDVQVTPGMTVFGGAGGRENEGGCKWTASTPARRSTARGVGDVADLTNAQEVAFTTSGGLGEAEVGGPTMSIVPKTGRQHVQGQLLHGGRERGMVGDNYTDELKAAGLTVPGQLLKLWDFSIGVGGPVMKDRLWFYAIARRGAHRSVPGMWANKNRRRRDKVDA